VVKTDSQFSTKVYSPNSVCGGQNLKELVVSKTPAQNNIHQSEKETEIVVTETKVIYQPISHIYNVQTAKQRFFLGHFPTQHWTLVVFLVVVGFISGCNHWQLFNY